MAELRLRLRMKSTKNVTLPSSTTLQQLYEKAAQELDTTNDNNLRAKYGYPVKMLIGSKGDRLVDLGVKTNEVIMFESSRDTSQPKYLDNEDCTKADSPPMVSEEMPLCKETIAETAVPEKPAKLQKLEKPIAKATGPMPGMYYDQDTDMNLEIKTVADDGNCLFASMAYIIDGTDSDERKMEMRWRIAELAMTDESVIDFLAGESREDHRDKIRRDGYWGGQIEVMLFARHYQLEVVVLDVPRDTLLRSPQEGQRGTVFLLYDGIHYDPLRLHFADIDFSYSVFPTSPPRLLATAVALCRARHLSHAFTDTTAYTTACEDCGARLQGDRDMQRHASATGHVRFAEYRG